MTYHLLLKAEAMAKKGSLAVHTYVRQWRKFRRLTQEKLAAQTGGTASGISQLEKGKNGFTDKSLAAYAKALDCQPADLLSHDPLRRDSFWPLCQQAENLEEADRRRLYGLMKGFLSPPEDKSE